jgi:hypothetical protein
MPASRHRGWALAAMLRARLRVMLGGTKEHRSDPQLEVQVMARGTTEEDLEPRERRFAAPAGRAKP